METNAGHVCYLRIMSVFKYEEDRQYWTDFADNVRMVIGYEKACDECLSFLTKYGKIEQAVKDLMGKYCRIEELVECLLKQFVKNEQYEKCAALSSIGAPMLIPDEIELNDFINNAHTVHSFNDNCRVCWEVFEYDGMIPFYSFNAYETPPQDYILLMTIIVNYFYDRQEYDKC